MASAEGFEHTINSFTHSKTGENVYLDLSREHNVILRPLSSRGSIALGAFWVKLLQHPNNYPVYSYPYRKLYQAGHKFQLQLHVEGFSFTIDLVSGQMIVKGQHVIDWFIHKFPEIMDGYLKPPKSVSNKLCEQHNAEKMFGLQYEREKIYKKYMEKWPLNVLENAVNVMNAGKEDKSNYESISVDGFLDGVDLETHCPIADLLNEDDTKDQLERLLMGRVIQGSVLYRLWKSTLQMWFSYQDVKLFIVTPHIDSDRLSDLCELFLQHKLTACIDTICVPMSSLYENFAGVRRTTINSFSAKDQVTIEYKILSQVVYPFKDFTTSFIAMVRDDDAFILQANTNFDKCNFVTSKCATVEYLKLDKGTFHQRYLDPILK